MKKQTKFLLVLLGILLIETVWSFTHAYDMQVWCTEYASALFLMLLFGLTYKKFQFSNLSYFIKPFCSAYIHIQLLTSLTPSAAAAADGEKSLLLHTV